MSIRPLRKAQPGVHWSADGTWIFRRDGACWYAYAENGDGLYSGIVPVFSAGYETLRGAVLAAEGRIRWVYSAALERKMDLIANELRFTSGEVRLVLSDRCDGVRPNRDGDRILQGLVESVSPTNAFCIVRGRHVPLAEVLRVVTSKEFHFSQSPASDPRDPLDGLRAVRSTTSEAA